MRKMCPHCIKNKDLKQENERLKHDLNNLLAIIHRDGGQYVSEHGLEMSVSDAHKVWGKRQVQLGEADRIFESISCLCAEGPEFMRGIEVIDAVLKETLKWHNFKKALEEK